MPLPIHLEKRELLLSNHMKPRLITHHPQVENQKINSTNVPGIPSTGVKGASTSSRSKPRSNTKTYRTLPVKSALKQVEAHSRMNKSNEKQKNHVDSSISYKRTVLHTKPWKPTGRLLPLGRQCPLVRSTALKSDCFLADPQETTAPVVQIILWYLDSGCSKHMTGDRSQKTAQSEVPSESTYMHPSET
ncbi:hypothetical protein Tco_1139663 [Tanacetum coccineum]